MRKAIFTVLTGGYEELNKAPKLKGWDSILLTDTMPVDCKGWKVVLVMPSKDPILLSRELKIISHRYLDYDLVCYLDANMLIRLPPPTVTTYFSHPVRHTIREEAERVIELGKADPAKVRKQLAAYQTFPDNLGLFQMGFFVRMHSPELNRLHEEWFKQVKKHTRRDQLSFPYALWKTGTQVNTSRNSKYYVIIKWHRFTTSPQDAATKI